MRAHVLTHVPVEGPGRFADLLSDRGFAVEIVRGYAGEAVPAAVATEDLVLVMGGPMGVGDVGSAQHPFLAAEVALLRRCLAEGIPVLGVCLGAQLLAHAAGARVSPNRRPDGSPAREVGWAPVAFAIDRPECAGLHRWEWMLHWHGDAFDLPAGAVPLASTPITPNQAFRLGRTIGLQFHPEVEVADIEAWLVADRDYCLGANGPDGVDRVRADTARLHAAWRPIADRFLGNCLDAILG